MNHYRSANPSARNVFVFLEIFSQEGGIQSYNKTLLKAYSIMPDQPQAEVFLLRDGPESQVSLPNIKFHYLKTKQPLLGRSKLALALLWCLLWQRPKQVFCGHINLVSLVQMLCRPLGIPYIVMTHGKEVWQPLPSKTQKALRQASQIWTVSRYTRDRLCASNHLPLDQVRLLPCTIDGNYFTPGPKSPTLLNQYGLTGTKVLMTVARLWSGDIYKGVDVTIRALPAIAQVFPQVKYLVIGRGDDQPRLAQLAKELGVAERVVFAGFVPTQDLIDHYRLADAYIMPSKEGFGIVYLEAMACGVPVLAGDKDGSADPLQDGELGWQVPHRDPDAVAAACIEIFKGSGVPGDPNYEHRCDGNWLRQQAISIFGTTAFSQRLEKLLEGKA